MLISIGAEPIYNPTNSIKGFLFPASLLVFLVICILIDNILTGVRWNPNVVLIYISLMAKDVDYFCIFIGHLYFF
jgi:hypothetical protein